MCHAGLCKLHRKGFTLDVFCKICISPIQKIRTLNGGFFNFEKILRIGIVFNDLERAIKKFKDFGFPCVEIMENKEIGLKVVSLPVCDIQIELLCCTDPNNEHDNVIKVRKGPFNYLCFEVEDLEVSI